MLDERILASRSYFLGFNVPEEQLDELKQVARDSCFIFVNSSSLEDLKEAVSRIRHMVGIFLVTDGCSEDLLAAMARTTKGYSDKRYFFSADAQDAIRSIDHQKYIVNSLAQTNSVVHLKNHLAQLVPPRLEELALFATDSAFPIIFGETTISFSIVSEDPLEEYEFLVLCETISDEFVGKTWVKINPKKFWDTYMKGDYDIDECLDSVKEWENQLLGIVNFNLSQARVIAEIGTVPTASPTRLRVGNSAVELTSLITHPENWLSHLFLPVGRIADKEGTMCLYFGIIPTDGDTMSIDLGENQFTMADPPEIDFL